MNNSYSHTDPPLQRRSLLLHGAGRRAFQFLGLKGVSDHLGDPAGALSAIWEVEGFQKFALNPAKGQPSSGHLQLKVQGDERPLSGAGQSPAASV